VRPAPRQIGHARIARHFRPWSVDARSGGRCVRRSPMMILRSDSRLERCANPGVAREYRLSGVPRSRHNSTRQGRFYLRATSEAREFAGDTGAKPGARQHMRERQFQCPRPDRPRLYLPIDRERNVGDAGVRPDSDQSVSRCRK
jgi:hypothetical protein